MPISIRNSCRTGLIVAILLVGCATSGFGADNVDPELARLQALTEKLEAEKGFYQTIAERNAQLVAALGANENTPTGKYEQKSAITDSSPLALALGFEALDKIGAEVCEKIGPIVGHDSVLVLLGSAENPPTFSNWLSFRQRMMAIDQSVKNLPPVNPPADGGRTISRVPLELISALPAAFNAVAGFWRRDVSETPIKMTIDDANLHSAVLRTANAQGWKIYHSLPALSLASLRQLSDLSVSKSVTDLEKYRTDVAGKVAFFEKQTGADAPAVKARAESVLKSIDALQTALVTENQAETGFMRIAREELVGRALYGERFVVGETNKSLGELADESRVRFISLKLASQAHSRVETRTFWGRRYHYESTLVGYYAIFTPAGRQVATGLAPRTYLRRAPAPGEIPAADNFERINVR